MDGFSSSISEFLSTTIQVILLAGADNRNAVGDEVEKGPGRHDILSYGAVGAERHIQQKEAF